jgi:hypothetical protein
VGAAPGKQSRFGDLLVLAAFTLGLLLYVLGQFEDYTWIVRDGRFYVNSNITLLENLSYEDIFARSWYEERLGWNYNLPAGFSNVALGSRGELYHFRPWILPLLSSPLFFAFGLYGVLAFNLMAYVAIMGLGYLYAARFAGRNAAAVATGLWVLGTGMVETVYDYSVDALLVAFFLAALELLRRKRGALAGVCIAATLIIKPTALLYAPAAAALLFELPKKERKAVLLRAIGGGAIALIIAGAINTYMYGAPWVFGYNRVVEVAGGEIQLASTGARFNTPLRDGLVRTFGGGYGLLSFYGVFGAFVFGVWPMLRRHFRFSLVALASAAGVLVVFSLYDWESDRFQYASFALLLPFLAWGLRVVANFIVGAARRLMRRRVESVAALAAVAAFSMSLAHAGRDGRAHPWREQTPIHELRQLVIPAHESEAISLVAESGSFVLEMEPAATRQSTMTLGRSGTWLPRGNLIVVGVSALASHLKLLLLLHALLAGLGFAFLASATRGFAPPAARLALLAVALTLHPIREMVAYGGDSLFAFVALAAGICALRTRRMSLAFALGTLAAFFLAAPIVAIAFAVPLALTLRDHPTASRRKIRLAGLCLGAWAAYGLVVYGRPFEGPESFVLIGGERFSVVPDVDALSSLLRQAHPARAAFAFALVGALGSFLLCFSSHRLVGICATILAVGFLFPSGHPHGGLESSFVAVLAPFALYAVYRVLPALAELWTPAKRGRRLFAATSIAMLLWGAGWRVAEANGPLEIATGAGVRDSAVHLGEIPCDFLAWENMSWECANHDGGTDGRTGLQLPDGARVGGERQSLFVIPTGRRGRRARRVEFNPVEGNTASLRWVIPDGYRGGAVVTIFWGDTMLRQDTLQPGEDERTEDFALTGEGPLRIRVEAATPGEWSAVGFSGQLD